MKDPYRHASQLILSGRVSGRFILIQAHDDFMPALKLAHSLDAMVMRLYKNCVPFADMPSGIILLTPLMLWPCRNYLRGGEVGLRTRVIHITPAEDSEEQARQLLQYGLASNRHILIRSMFRPGREALTIERVKELVKCIKEEIQVSFGGPHKLATGHPPRGLIILTENTITHLRLYTTTLPVPGAT